MPPPLKIEATVSLTNDKIVIGRLGPPFGVRGWLHIHSLSGRYDTFLQNRMWWCARPNHPWQQINIAETRPHGTGLLAKMVGVDEREHAAEWRGANIAVTRADLPKLTAADEYYWCDLIGLQAHNTHGITLGIVNKLLASGGQDTLCITAADGQNDILVPFVAPFVHRVDLTAGVIILDWERHW